MGVVERAPIWYPNYARGAQPHTANELQRETNNRDGVGARERYAPPSNGLEGCDVDAIQQNAGEVGVWLQPHLSEGSVKNSEALHKQKHSKLAPRPLASHTQSSDIPGGPFKGATTLLAHRHAVRPQWRRGTGRLQQNGHGSSAPFARSACRPGRPATCLACWRLCSLSRARATRPEAAAACGHPQHRAGPRQVQAARARRSATSPSGRTRRRCSASSAACATP